MASSYRPSGVLQAEFKNSALAITSLLKAAQGQTQDAYKQGYADALADTLEALQSGLAVHQEGDASLGIASLIDWIESRQHGVQHNDPSDSEDVEDPPVRPSATHSAPAAPETPSHASAHGLQAAARRSSVSPQPPAPRLPVVSSLPANADFTFSFPMPSTSQSQTSQAAGKKSSLRHGRQALRREGVNMDTEEAAPGAAGKKRKWWEEDTLTNGLVQLDLDNGGHRQQQEDQALRLFGEVSADARPFKRVLRR